MSKTKEWIESLGDKAKQFIRDVAEEIIAEIEDTPDTSKVTRVEVIDEKGRSYVNWKTDNDVYLSFQDNNRTLKIFIKQKIK